MSEQISSFEARRLQKEKKRRREETKVLLGLFAFTVAFGAWLVSNGYVDNPFDIHQDTTVSNDTTAQTDSHR